MRPVESDTPVPGEDSSQGGDSQNGGKAVKTGDNADLSGAVVAVSGGMLALGAVLAVVRRRKVC